MNTDKPLKSQSGRETNVKAMFQSKIKKERTSGQMPRYCFTPIIERESDSESSASESTESDHGPVRALEDDRPEPMAVSVVSEAVGQLSIEYRYEGGFSEECNRECKKRNLILSLYKLLNLQVSILPKPGLVQQLLQRLDHDEYIAGALKAESLCEVRHDEKGYINATLENGILATSGFIYFFNDSVQTPFYFITEIESFEEGTRWCLAGFCGHRLILAEGVISTGCLVNEYIANKISGESFRALFWLAQMPETPL